MSARCRSCNAPMIWTLTENGRRMPLDAEPVDLDSLTNVSGLFAIRDQGRGRGPLAIAATPDQLPDDQLYRSHFATCPNAAQHRRR